MPQPRFGKRVFDWYVLLTFSFIFFFVAAFLPVPSPPARRNRNFVVAIKNFVVAVKRCDCLPAYSIDPVVNPGPRSFKRPFAGITACPTVLEPHFGPGPAASQVRLPHGYPQWLPIVLGLNYVFLLLSKLHVFPSGVTFVA